MDWEFHLFYKEKSAKAESSPVSQAQPTHLQSSDFHNTSKGLPERIKWVFQIGEIRIGIDVITAAVLSARVTRTCKSNDQNGVERKNQMQLWQHRRAGTGSLKYMMLSI